MNQGKSIDCPYYLISRASLGITSALKKGFATAGFDRVSPAYMGVLWNLWQKDGIKVNELGRVAGLGPSTMTGLLDRMERDELIKREDDPDDRRAQLIFLTPEGRRAEEPVSKVVTATLDSILDGIPAAEIENTKNVLRQILAKLFGGMIND